MSWGLADDAHESVGFFPSASADIIFRAEGTERSMYEEKRWRAP